MKHKNKILKHIDERIEILKACLKTWRSIRKRPKAMKMLRKRKKFYDTLVIDSKARIEELKTLKRDLRQIIK